MQACSDFIIRFGVSVVYPPMFFVVVIAISMALVLFGFSLKFLFRGSPDK
jgi:hypothetical protein